MPMKFTRPQFKFRQQGRIGTVVWVATSSLRALKIDLKLRHKRGHSTFLNYTLKIYIFFYCAEYNQQSFLYKCLKQILNYLIKKYFQTWATMLPLKKITKTCFQMFFFHISLKKYNFFKRKSLCQILC